MNKVFKVIWNHATQTWTAVSELGHAKGKTKSKKIVKLTALAGAVMSVVGTAQAAINTEASTITINSSNPNNVTGTNQGIKNINIGTGANTYRNDGKNAEGTDIVSHDAIAIGSDATGTGDKAVAIGKGANATKENGIAIGFDATNQSIDSVAIGREATSSKDMDVAIGKQAKATGGESLAFGSQSKASNEAAIAVGKESNAAGSSAVATGYQSNAAGDNAVAVGNKATASQVNDIAVGLRASATGGRSIATGTAATASGAYSIATGFTAKAKADNSIAQGNNAVANKESDIAIGTNSVANGSEGVCNNGEKTNPSLPGGGATGCDGSAVALGKEANATGTNAVAVGVGAKASKKNTTALGSGANSTIENAVALGSNSTTSAFVPTNSATVGNHTYGGFAGATSNLSNGAVVSVGKAGEERQIQNVAAGRISATSTDAINGSQLFAVANRVENLSPFTFTGHNGSGSSPAEGTYKYDPKSNTNNILKLIAGAGLKLTSNGTNEYTLSVEGAGSTGSTGPAGTKGDTGPKGEDGSNYVIEVEDDNANGTHTITITNLGDGSVTTTIVKDGKNGKDGATGATGADGKNAEADVKDNGDGTHTVTIKDGNGNTTTTIVKDGKNGKDGVMTWDIKSTGNKTPASETNAKTIKHTNTVNMEAGKNLTVEQSSNNDSATVKFALDSNVTNLDKVVVNGKDGVDGKDGVTITAPGGKDGNDGLDGKVGISGKDGKDAVSISGKDGVGQIGLTGPKGADGKDGASVTISTDKGTTTVAERDGGEKINRVIYTDKDKDGNDIKREIATLDDGLKFTGDDGQTVNRTLGSNLNIKGGATDSTTAKNIRVTKAADGEGLDVNLANNIKLDNNGSLNIGGTTVKNGSVTNLDHHIDNPTTVVDDSVLNITDEKKKEAATVGDVLNSGWNLQANGKPVDAVTHGNNVNFASDKGTVTVTANSDGKTSVVNLDVNVDNDTITVNNKGQLVASGATNFNVATKDGGNKVAKKGGSSTTKITSGKTITYTAGKNIAIEQNGGDILVSTTNDVDHNSVTTNDLTVNKGGNIDMGGNQIHNVKAGTKDTDAVNVSQLKQSIGDVHKRINKVGKEARGGIAGANAAAGLPQVYIPGKSMVAASAGTFKGESAVAVGYSRSSDNGKVIFKLQGNANTQGDVGGSVGVGYQW